MNEIIFEIKDQIYLTIKLACDFLKDINPSTILLTIAFLYVLFLRKWNAKKIFSFVLIIFLLFILLVRIEALLLANLEAEGANISIGIGRTIFLMAAAAVFIYHAAIKE